MAGLGIRLEPDDRMIINGAAIHFMSSAQIRLVNKARFLFGKQIMQPEEANSPARRIYYALQIAYIGLPEEQARALEEARYLMNLLLQESVSKPVHALLTESLHAAISGNLYLALKNIRHVIRHEDNVFNTVSAMIPDRSDSAYLSTPEKNAPKKQRLFPEEV